MTSPAKVTFSSFTLTIVGELHAPAQGTPDRQGAAIVISHPMTGVKEQTSSTYARALSQAGFYALTFDAGYQGESSGEPRGLEDPHQRVEDNKAAVTYLTTLGGKVNPDKIGMLGICASGGYSSYAAQGDVRVKALATVSAACVGQMTRNGGLQPELKENREAIAAALQAASQWRTNEAKQHQDAPEMYSVDIDTLPSDANPFFKDAAQYYGTERGKHPRSDRRVPPSSYDLMVSYDSFAFQRLISPRPLLMIAGSEAVTKHITERAIALAQEPKELFIVAGETHFGLYDNLTESGPKVIDFFGRHLA